ncbi:hypothetical protein A2U01_0055488, partial [Trifolium medium]|nr:hypothetical protein [Trifolium medium]
VRGAGPRASLGRPFQSPPSPEVRHIRGGESVDSGDWTEVCYRRRKEFREADRGRRSVQRYRHQRNSVSIPAWHSFHDDHLQSNYYERYHEHYHGERNQSRYNRERHGDRSRSRNQFRRRSRSAVLDHDGRVATMQEEGRRL